MIEIELQKIPNQEFTKELNGVFYRLKLRTFKGMLLMDIMADDTVIKKSVRVCPNTLIIPYQYTTKGGNFLFFCQNNDYPNYKNFGITQQLIFLSDEEIKSLQG